MKLTFRKLFVVIILLWGIIVLPSCRQDYVPQPEYTSLKEALEEIGLISLIKENPDEEAMAEKQKGELEYVAQYSMFFNQDLNHDDEGGESFKQRVCILFRGFDRPTVYVTHGYDWYRFNDGMDLANNLNANVVCVEHRNYGESYNADNGVWNYQTVAQASADLHDIYQTLKPVFKGKWMSTGTSKSAETSITYAYYYPYDMNLAAAFCGPFVQGTDDRRFGEYLFNEVGTPEERELMKTAIRHTLEDGEEGMYKDVCAWFVECEDRVPVFTEYVFNVFDTFFQVFQYMTPTTGRSQMLELLATDNEALSSKVSTTLMENRDETYRAYFVECVRQMGWQNDGYDYFSDLLEGTSFDYTKVPASVVAPEDRAQVDLYDGSVYADIVNNFFMTSTCPLLLYYSHDDPWSAGKPNQVGANVKVVVNPIGKHSDVINDPTYCSSAVKQEVMQYVGQFIY